MRSLKMRYERGKRRKRGSVCRKGRRPDLWILLKRKQETDDRGTRSKLDLLPENCLGNLLATQSYKRGKSCWVIMMVGKNGATKNETRRGH